MSGYGNRSSRPARAVPVQPSAVSWALKQSCGSPAHKLVLVTMAQLADGKRECFPGARYLADVAGITVTEAYEAIDTLRGISLIARMGSKRADGSGAIYRLAVDGPIEEPTEFLG